MKKILFFSTLVFLSLSLSGCGNLLYLSKLGWHQSLISFHSVPVEEVLENEGVDRQTKEKILLVQEVKRYGEERLGLTRTKNYSTYVEVGSPVLYVITASEKDSLQPCHWSFPIIGN
ncbi:MAG TPA: aminopeptidase, partial [Thermodesulfobacteriota bacterium]|nr:aminopeptidase [Thermodesulfobacteriota bacterium]